MISKVENVLYTKIWSIQILQRMNRKMIARSKKDILIGIVTTWNLHRLAVLFQDGVPLVYFERNTMEPYQIEGDGGPPV